MMNISRQLVVDHFLPHSWGTQELCTRALEAIGMATAEMTESTGLFLG